MKKVVILLALLAVMAVPSAFAAEKPYSVHVFPFGGYFIGGDWLKGSDYKYFDSAFLYGGRLGFTLGQNFTIEGGYEFNANQTVKSDIMPEEGDADITMWYGDVLIEPFSSRKVSPYFMAGFGNMEIDTDVPISDTGEPTFMWGVGVKYYPLEFLGLRVEARQAIIDPTPDNIIVIAGLDFRFLGKWPKKDEPVGDSDGDGVNDKLDKCPGTASGVQVDSNGCPSDSDGDGVLDGADKCPDTPAGTKVDETGCADGDADGDGVKDMLDRCPNTPAGAKVNLSGCPLDGDNDGVYDGLDDCPKTEAGVKVDEKGCPADSDGDTVPDTADKCPNTPKNTPVDQTGCPEAAEKGDGDNDGVADSRDKCPHSAPGAKVDEKGCEIIEEKLVLEGVLFGTGSSRIDPKSYPKLNSAAEILKANPAMKVEVQGYTDSTGSQAANVRLSEARAKSVYLYLIKVGVAKENISYKGYGPDNPIASNDTVEGRTQNRRIEFKILE